jgi:hypothetical protein
VSPILDCAIPKIALQACTANPWRGRFTRVLTDVFTSRFEEEAARVFSGEELDDLVIYLAEHPTAGDVVPGAGGVRKIRWCAHGHGKRGGAHVIYYYMKQRRPLFLLRAYAKNRKQDLSPPGKARPRSVTDAIRRSFGAGE